MRYKNRKAINLKMSRQKAPKYALKRRKKCAKKNKNTMREMKRSLVILIFLRAYF